MKREKILISILIFTFLCSTMASANLASAVINSLTILVTEQVFRN